MSAAPDRTHALQFAFAAHIRDPANVPRPAGVEPRRMAIYTDLFFNNVESLLSANFPVIRSLYDDAPWNALVRDFYRDHRSHTPLFTEIAREFIRHLESRAERGLGDPPFLLELAHYEWSELALTLDEHDIADVDHDPDGDLLAGVPIVSPTARVLAYHYPVHRISAEFRPDAPNEQPVLLLLVRDRNDDVRFLEIDPLSALLMERLQANREDSGNECLTALLRDIGRADDDGLQGSGAAILQRLRERDAILGTRRAR
ncbi:MAG: putative DNA-binding domain-containing protein [Dokdonella sp.]